VAGCCEHGDELSGAGATELLLIIIINNIIIIIIIIIIREEDRIRSSEVSAASFYFVLQRSKYSRQHSVLSRS
jgi:hypothetical protein